MKMYLKKIITFVGVWALLIFAAGCAQIQRSLDVVGREAITSFDAVLQAIPNNLERDEMNGGWSLAAPDGKARFIWSKDWSRTPIHDVMIEFDASPFIAAGLNPEILPEHFAYYDGMLVVGTKLGENVLEYSGEPTPLASFEHIVSLSRDSIGYHPELDHYGINLGNGNMFEWAKDMSVNDLDIVFVLNPEPFVAAGVDPNAVEGWLYAPVEMMGETVYKFLKPFNIFLQS